MTTAFYRQPTTRRSLPAALLQQVRQSRGAVLLAAAVVALCLVVAFIGVLQGAVQRGELFRQQLSIGGSNVQSLVQGRFDAGTRATRHVLGAQVAPGLVLAAQVGR